MISPTRRERLLDLLADLPGALYALILVGGVVGVAIYLAVVFAWWMPFAILGLPVFFGLLILNDS